MRESVAVETVMPMKTKRKGVVFKNTKKTYLNWANFRAYLISDGQKNREKISGGFNFFSLLAHFTFYVLKFQADLTFFHF